MGWLQRLLYGRYGMDRLNSVLLTAGFIISVLSVFIRWFGFSIIVWVILAAVLFRMFSRNFEARRRENQWFLRWFDPLSFRFSGWFNEKRYQFERWKQNRAYKQRQKAEYAFFACPHCKQKMRVPKGRGKIEITCPNCGNAFVKKT